MQTIKAIETQYKGYRFRSRLEARWAVFFDALGIEWVYEPEGYDLGEAGWYLPDFLLSELNSWAEVKPYILTSDELEKCYLLAKETRMPCLLLVDIPSPKVYGIFDPASNDWLQNFKNGEISQETDGGYPGGDYEIHYPNEKINFVSGKGTNFSRRKIQKAIVAARSARFEHGETPS